MHVIGTACDVRLVSPQALTPAAALVPAPAPTPELAQADMQTEGLVEATQPATGTGQLVLLKEALPAPTPELAEADMQTEGLVEATQSATGTGQLVLLKEALSDLDQRLLQRLQCGSIRLVRSAWTLQSKIKRMPYRQELEELERSGESPSPLLSPDEAVALVARGDRSAGSLTYCARTCHTSIIHPTP